MIAAFVEQLREETFERSVFFRGKSTISYGEHILPAMAAANVELRVELLWTLSFQLIQRCEKVSFGLTLCWAAFREVS